MDATTSFARLDAIRQEFFAGTREGEFAKKLGVSKQTWSTWKGRRGLAQRAVPGIVEKLRAAKVHVSADWLLLGLGEKPYRGSTSPPRHEDVHIARVIEMMEATDQTGRMEAYAAAREALREYERTRQRIHVAAKKTGA